MELFREGVSAGVSTKAIADLIGICSRTLRRWGIAFQALASGRIAARDLHGMLRTDSHMKKGSACLIPSTICASPISLPRRSQPSSLKNGCTLVQNPRSSILCAKKGC
jgi:hypothetical protein